MNISGNINIQECYDKYIHTRKPRLLNKKVNQNQEATMKHEINNVNCLILMLRTIVISFPQLI